MDNIQVSDVLLDDYKEKISQNLASATKSFVAVGYYLKQIRDNQLYSKANCSNIWEYAMQEFGISKSSASRFMDINDKFSINGNSPELLDQYKAFSSSKLQEMLYLSDDQIAQVSPSTTVTKIRELKKPFEIVATSQQERRSEITEPTQLSASIPTDNGLVIDFTCGIDSLAKEHEAAGSCPPNQGSCMRNKEEGEKGKKICTKCWKDWLTREKILRNMDAADKGLTEKTEPESKLSYLNCAAYDFNKFGRGCTECFNDKPENNCPYDRNEYFEKAKQQEEFRIRRDVLKEMCDSLCNNRSSVLEKSNYSMDAIKNVSRGTLDFSFGFGDDGARHSKYDAEYKAKPEQYRVKEFNGSGKWVFEAGEVDQQIWNYNGNTWRFKQHEDAKLNTVDESHETLDNQLEIVNDMDESVIETSETVIEEPESKIEERSCSNCRYNIMSRDEYFLEHPDTKMFPCDPCGAFDNWEPKELESESSRESMNCDFCGYDGDGQCEYPSHDIEDQCNFGEKWVPKEEAPEQIETIEAENIQTVPSEPVKPIFSAKHHLKEAIEREEMQIAQLGETWKLKQPDTLLKHQTILLAFKCYLTDMEYPEPEPVKQKQPELPIMKNNDQRKEWAENYKAWGEWYYDKHIDCHYYKYEFPNGDILVVEEYLDRELYWGNDRKDEQYYHFIQKKRQKYEKNKTYEKKYSHDTASMTEVIEYLKEFQKKVTR